MEEPLEWILLGTLPAETTEQLEQHRDWYACRPLIEDFHQVEKTGCNERASGSRPPSALFPMLGLLAIVAVRVLQLRWWCHEGGASPAHAAATSQELDVVKGLGNKAVTARFCARGGGSGRLLGPERDGEPGWQTLWRGYQRLQDMVLGLKIRTHHTRASPNRTRTS